MKTQYDYKSNQYDVQLSEQEIQDAFQSEENLNQLIYDIVKSTHGEYIADQLFKHYDD